ncbi:YlbF family regulator [Melioribacter sp. OK-6-Me]|uniref:YlbF family regulator n=1 Tax=unclassified Melioribacter TaxID=2627329 RepID=UPI003ED98CD8
MIDNQIKFITDNFIRSFQAVPEVIDYLDALSAYENDKEINDLVDKYYLLSSQLQEKQYDGTLEQEDINELSEIASKIQNNPLNVKLAEKQNNLKSILQECNEAISNEISMDFAKLAAPSSCCS